ncbi:hypothetical protein DPQ33_09075 [Oceanidesulfovibrio indonesiensis]|uniref:Nodulation protein B n=1 Tax=Oceanidesulfovibrio indonesiensis TaxID=54767 RepID=A0A7M3MEK3_9BACT|nr:hypothetical protein [Oceanidesulfovibrio indonesiensis]TVM17328.1 hypothetical protein DPQ33_09075 [Oceanidesulfovibrio indonesiensis]
MKLVISIDVEEEGLFSGKYSRTPPGVRNVSHLDALNFVYDEFGFPLTLLTSYQVAQDDAASDMLIRMREERGAEIGAHLHPWNTPPLEDVGPEPVRSDAMPMDILRAKMATLFDSLEQRFGKPATSFRMGRWDFGAQVEQLLPEFGILVDASHAPLRHARGGPDRFLTPSYDPYLLPAVGDYPRVTEAPLTMLPVMPITARCTHTFARLMPKTIRESILANYSAVAAAGIQPVWYPSTSMRWAARLHRRRGGNVLVMFLHSSELMPGHSPNFPNQEAVDRLVEKIRHFLGWLTQSGPIQGVTLSELHKRAD